jgi:hydroxymethylglutaryl-CoA lyase
MTAITQGLPGRATVVEVGPRDGLQNEARHVDTDAKVELIARLAGTGVRSFEATAFVAPHAVPQMADAVEVVTRARARTDAELTALVPNRRGAERAAEAGVDGMVVFVSASESHNAKNVNRRIAASLRGFEEVAAVADDAGLPVHGAIATAFGCPFEGDVPVGQVVEVAEALRELGVRRVTLGDTTGMATPPLVEERCRALRAALPDVEIVLHFHNTRAVGLVNVMAGLHQGVTRYESSIGGLGGCPFAPEATGNIATEDLVYLLDELGISSGIDLETLIEVAPLAERAVGHPLAAQVSKAGPRLKRFAMDSVRTAAR